LTKPLNDSDPEKSALELEEGVNAGLPRLYLGQKPTSHFEFWPVWLMYIPVVLYWLLLSLRYRSFGLPMVVNPNITLGGMVGESKHAIFCQAGEVLWDYILPYVTLRLSGDVSAQVNEALEKAERAGFGFPLVIKPDLGCRGRGVALLENEQQLRNYLQTQHPGQLFLLQELAPYSAEAGVFYIRRPDAQNGKIVSLAFKYRPTVIGDGISTLQQLIESHPRSSKLAGIHCAKNRDRLHNVPAPGEEVALEFAGSHCRGSIFRNGDSFVTKSLERKLDHLLKDLPGFHYGRLDIKFKDIHQLQAGEDFVILEINGASSEQAHIWDSRTSLWHAMSVLFKQYRDLFAMGAIMRQQGYPVPSAFKLIYTWLRELGWFGSKRVGLQ